MLTNAARAYSHSNECHAQANSLIVPLLTARKMHLGCSRCWPATVTLRRREKCVVEFERKVLYQRLLSCKLSSTSAFACASLQKKWKTWEAISARRVGKPVVSLTSLFSVSPALLRCHERCVSRRPCSPLREFSLFLCACWLCVGRALVFANLSLVAVDPSRLGPHALPQISQRVGARLVTARAALCTCTTLARRATRTRRRCPWHLWPPTPASIRAIRTLKVLRSPHESLLEVILFSLIM